MSIPAACLIVASAWGAGAYVLGPLSGRVLFRRNESRYEHRRSCERCS